MDLLLDLSGVPVRAKRARLESALRDSIRTGRLAAGSRLPASRDLCRDLEVSRGVVVEAYAQLAAEGYLQTRRGGGTIVAPAATPETANQAPRSSMPVIRFNLDPSTPATAEFPRSLWAAALNRAIRTMPDERFGWPDPAGTLELRQALAAYLARARGADADPRRVVITSGTRQSMMIIWTALTRRGTGTVAVEHPGWSGAADTARVAGLDVRSLPMDSEGVTVEGLRSEPRVQAIAIAPAHQFPTGTVLSAARRQDLLTWARARGRRLIIEDDFDAEYRYDRHPIGCLQGVAPDQVVYAGSTSKTLSPALRVGWLVVPDWILPSVLTAAATLGSQASPVAQVALASLIERGDLDRHLRRQRRRYEQRRAALLDALSTHLPGRTVTGVSAGLFAVLELPAAIDGGVLVTRARSRGLVLGRRGTTPDALLIGYANLPAASAPSVVAELAALVTS